MSTENKKLVPFLEKEFGPLSFSSFMRAARSSLGLTQVEMARRLKITAGTLCDIEKYRVARETPRARQMSAAALAGSACMRWASATSLKYRKFNGPIALEGAG